MSTIENDLVSNFEIRELTGDQRTLILRNRGLPYRPFELSGTQRKMVEWYPGSPIGTLQVFGAKEEPTTISGAWKDKYLGGIAGSCAAELAEGATEVVDGVEAFLLSSTVFNNVRDLVAVVDDMRRKGNEVQVTWLNQTRRGIIDRFTARWQTGHDVEWELAFEWISQGETFSEIPFHNTSTDLGDLPNKAQSLVDDLVNNVSALVPQAGDSFADVSVKLAGAGAKLQALTDELTDMASQASRVVMGPTRAARRTVGILEGLKMEAELLCSISSNTADGIALDLGELKSLGKVLAQRGNVRARASTATALRNLAARESARIAASTHSEDMRVFQARDNQDLRDVSQTFYGTPDDWRSIMIFNQLSSSKLTAGQVIFVPARPSEVDC